VRRGGSFGVTAGAAVLIAVGVVACASSPKRAEPVVRKLTINGNAALSDRQIEKKILTTKTGWWPFAGKRYFDPVIWEVDLQRIKRLYGSHGYYQAEIDRDRVTPQPRNGVALEVDVREGQPTRIGSLDVQGLQTLPEADRRALQADLPVKVGAVFDEEAWAAAKQLLRTTLRNRGYADAAVDGSALIDVGTRQAACTLLVTPGAIYRFGSIRVDNGQGASIQPWWIWEQVRLAIPEGALYSEESLTEAQRRISNLGVFAAVKVTTAPPDPQTGRIDVLVETRQAPLHTLKLGAGFRLDQIRNEGRLIGEWTNRNFLGGMRRLTIHAEAGWAFIPNTYAVVTDDQSIALRNGPIARLRLEFQQPRFLGRPSLRENSTIEGARTLEQTYNDLGGHLGNGVIWQPRASLSIYPSHHLQGDELNGPPGSGVLTAPLTLGCHATGSSCFVWLSYLEEVVTWDRRDNAVEPRRGFYGSLELQQGGGPLQGDFNYFRVLPDVRGYFSVGDDAPLTFAARLKVGELIPTSGNPDDSAVVTRFYGGGAQSMRGFNDRRLSPLLVSQLPASLSNPNPPIVTLPIGGNGLIDGSGEIRYAVTPNLILAVFTDFGQVTQGRVHPSDFAHVLVAVGFGLRYLTPVGPVRIDFARRLQLGRPPPLFAVDATGKIVAQSYKVDDSCFGLGGSGGDGKVTDNLCVLHISIGEAF
jgi:translocation and assembly module TamA